MCVFNKSNRVYLWYIKCTNGEREREESEREMISQVFWGERFKKKKVKKKRNFASFLTFLTESKKTEEAAFSSTTS